jgi:SAM-dependent methyltransferase
MPDAEALARMYGPAYASAGVDDASLEDPKQPERLLSVLARREPGLFVDFGCGSGSLLVRARGLGWNAVGVEFDAEVARKVAVDSGCSVLLGIEGLLSSSPRADVLHLGDVVEHLTAPDQVLKKLMGALAPGGWLVSQGPLEAGPCLFAAALRKARSLRAARPVEMPPYHVLQATVTGQRELFERVGLEPVEFFVTEVDWPAPSRLSREVIRSPRSLALLGLRRLSRAASSLSEGRLGNRYFYIGRLPQTPSLKASSA